MGKWVAEVGDKVAAGEEKAMLGCSGHRTIRIPHRVGAERRLTAVCGMGWEAAAAVGGGV